MLFSGNYLLDHKVELKHLRDCIIKQRVTYCVWEFRVTFNYCVTVYGQPTAEIIVNVGELSPVGDVGGRVGPGVPLAPDRDVVAQSSPTICWMG